MRLKTEIIKINSKCSFPHTKKPKHRFQLGLSHLSIHSPYPCAHTYYYDPDSPLISLIYTIYYPLHVLTSLLPASEFIHSPSPELLLCKHAPFPCCLSTLTQLAKHRSNIRPFVPLLHDLPQLADWLYFK